MFFRNKSLKEIKELKDFVEKLESDLSLVKIHQGELEASIRILNTKVMRKLGTLPKNEDTKDLKSSVLLPMV